MITCDQVVIGVGPWIRDLWAMLDLPATISMRDAQGRMHDDMPMWRFWQLEEGVLDVPPDLLTTNDGKLPPPVLHVDTDAPLYSDTTGRSDHRPDVGDLLQA